MKKYYQKNERIRSTKLRVIKDDGENLGEISKKEALEIARREGKDLVVIAENAKPPVAKILDFNKFLYEEKKKSSASKAKSKRSELKELRFGPNIDAGDLTLRIEQARRFLEENNKVRFTIRLKGRQRALPQIGIDKLEKVEKELSDVAKTEGGIKRIGNNIVVTFLKK